MTNPSAILQNVRQAGGRLECAGDKLRVLLPADCSPALKAAIRQYKCELLDFLNANISGNEINILPWLHTAKQILAGEFEGLLNKSVRRTLEIGLRNISHPQCQQALQQLTRNNKPK